MTRTRGKRTAAGGDGEGTPPTESRTVGGDGGLNILERLAAAAVPCADFVEAPLEASSLQAWRSSSFQALVSSSRRRWRSSSVFLPSRLPPHAFSLPLTVLLARSRSSQRLYFNVAFTNLRWKPLESTADTSSSSPPLGARAEMRSTSEATFMRLCTLGYEFSCARFVRWTLRYESAVTCCPGTRRFSTALFYAGFHWPVLGFPGWPLVWCERARLVLARLASASARVEESFWPSASVHAAGCGDSLAPTGERRRGDLGRYPAKLTSLEPLR